MSGKARSGASLSRQCEYISPTSKPSTAKGDMRNALVISSDALVTSSFLYSN